MVRTLSSRSVPANSNILGHTTYEGRPGQVSAGCTHTLSALALVQYACMEWATSGVTYTAVMVSMGHPLSVAYFPPHYT